MEGSLTEVKVAKPNREDEFPHAKVEEDPNHELQCDGKKCGLPSCEKRKQVLHEATCFGDCDRANCKIRNEVANGFRYLGAIPESQSRDFAVLCPAITEDSGIPEEDS